MDQFTYAERATDWRANNNIAESIYAQMRREPHPCPAGSSPVRAPAARWRRSAATCATAGTPPASAASTPSASVFFDHYVSGVTVGLTCEAGSRIEGIGRPRVEASFMPGVLDAMVKVPDRWSLAAMHVLWAAALGRPVGGSTGTNLIAALECMRIGDGQRAPARLGRHAAVRRWRALPATTATGSSHKAWDR
jgi:cysteine synthase A